MNRLTLTPMLMAVVALIVALPAAGEPAVERTLVHAVADADTDRILVRWLQVEGSVHRFTHFDVVRREAGETTLVQLNAEPIGAMTTVAEIVALFTAPGNEDALAGIQASFGAAYASELLALQEPVSSETQTLQLQILPDQNYAAAIALGFGLMDESVAPGVTYVYEVWGLDGLGYREERLGRAVATTGQPVMPQPVGQVDCVEIGDARDDMAVHLRWAEPQDAATHYITGYDVYRAPLDPGDDCTTTANGPGVAGSFRVNAFPSQRTTPGRTALGEKLFSSSCASCHAAADPRNTDPGPAGPGSGVRGGTLQQFHRLQYSEILKPAEFAEHDTPILNALDPEELRAIFEWIDEFHVVDDGRHTPADPLVEGETYCYDVLPRDLMGQYGAAPATGTPCTVRDALEPDVPARIAAQRVDLGGYETCEISWQRNAEAGDDTVEYELYRMSPDPPRAATDASLRVAEPEIPIATVVQPAGGDRVVYQDPALSVDDAGQRFFYAVKAVDDSGNVSDFSGWVPCVPRDIVAPPAGFVSLSCCDNLSYCVDTNNGGPWQEWLDEGGAKVIIFDPPDNPADCPGVTVHSTPLDDTFGFRHYRAFNDGEYAPGPDYETEYLETFAPLIDSKIQLRHRPFDRSGNLGGFSDSPFYFVRGQFQLPAPRIVSVTLDTGTDHFEIKFRSLAPENLLGFVLYTNHLEDDGSLPADIGTRAVRYHSSNLAPNPMSTPAAYPFQWIVLQNAAPLSTPGRLPANGSDGGYLAYDPVDDLYVLDVAAQGNPLEGIVLNLLAVSWTGQEGHYTPYAFGGNSDGVLEWPKFRTKNVKAITDADDLATTYVPAVPAVDLTWTAIPKGCDYNDARPFVVFRKRGLAPRWEQISPLITCDQNAATPENLLFRDTDIEPGRGITYHYTVIRFGLMGEFNAQLGPVSELVP